MSDQQISAEVGRRTVLAGAAAAAFTVVRPSAVRGSRANTTLTLGMIGCGGRGNWIAERFVKHGPYKFVACADYYPDHVERFGDRFGVDAAHRYTTLSAYKKLLDDDLDAVVIESPPYFHPEHAAASVDADKHVFLSKPIAVDAPGCLSILESGKRARSKKLVYLIDFQTRANEHYRAAAKRVHDGELGRLVCAEARYPWSGGKPEPPKTPEDKLRRWYCFRAISGDFIVEQSIHALDVASWFLNADPISASGVTGSRGLRKYGDIKDYFSLQYMFPNDVPLSFYSVQAVPKAPNEIACRVYGSRGLVETDYYRGVSMRGLDPSTGGECADLYDSGAVVNIKEFHQFVTEGKTDNLTVEPSVRSNLTAILGRTAGYKGRPVTWKEMMAAKETMELDLSGFKS